MQCCSMKVELHMAFHHSVCNKIESEADSPLKILLVYWTLRKETLSNNNVGAFHLSPLLLGGGSIINTH